MPFLINTCRVISASRASMHVIKCRDITAFGTIVMWTWDMTKNELSDMLLKNSAQGLKSFEEPYVCRPIYCSQWPTIGIITIIAHWKPWVGNVLGFNGSPYIIVFFFTYHNFSCIMSIFTKIYFVYFYYVF